MKKTYVNPEMVVVPLMAKHMIANSVQSVSGLEDVDFIDFITPEGDTVGFVVREGEDVDERTADGILARGGYEIYPVEPLLPELRDDGIEGYLLPFG